MLSFESFIAISIDSIAGCVSVHRDNQGRCECVDAAVHKRVRIRLVFGAANHGHHCLMNQPNSLEFAAPDLPLRDDVQTVTYHRAP